MWDDSKQVGPYTKFFGQFIAVAIVVVYGDVWIRHLPFTGIEEISPWIGIPFTFFAIIGMANAVNTSDGLDGLAGGESLLSLIVIAFLAYIADGIEACVIATAVMVGFLDFCVITPIPLKFLWVTQVVNFWVIRQAFWLC